MKREVDSEVVNAVVKNSETGKYLLMNRNDEKDEYPGFWEFPGGGLENETPVEGVKRELKEETELEADPVKGGKPFVWHSDYTDRDIRSYSYLVKVQEKNVELSHEHTEYKCLRLEEIFHKKHFAFIKRDLKNAGVELD